MKVFTLIPQASMRLFSTVQNFLVGMLLATGDNNSQKLWKLVEETLKLLIDYQSLRKMYP